jgi:hypothetical protein
MNNQEKLIVEKLKKTKIKLEIIRKQRKRAVTRAKLIGEFELERLKKEYELDFELMAIKYEKVIRDNLSFGLKSYINKGETSVDKSLIDYLEGTTKAFRRQFEKPESNYGLEKLVRYKEQKTLLDTMGAKQTYLVRYMLEAVNTFCRKKRNFYDVERAKRNAKPDESYKHNPGAACRAYFESKGCDDEWLSTKAIKHIETATISDEVIENVRNYLSENNVKKDIIQTFLDRIDGMKFTEMAKKYRGRENEISAKESTFRNRFDRLRKSPIVNCDDFRKLLLKDYENYTE